MLAESATCPRRARQAVLLIRASIISSPTSFWPAPVAKTAFLRGGRASVRPLYDSFLPTHTKRWARGTWLEDDSILGRAEPIVPRRLRLLDEMFLPPVFLFRDV